MIFYQRLVSLKEAADFFRPYFSYISNNPGDFYVYLSKFVTPELVDLIKKDADPFNISFEEDPNIEKRNELLKTSIMSLLKLIDSNLQNSNQLSKEEISFLYFIKSLSLDKLPEYSKQSEESASKSVLIIYNISLA